MTGVALRGVLAVARALEHGCAVEPVADRQPADLERGLEHAGHGPLVYPSRFALVTAASSPAALNPATDRPSVRECVSCVRQIIAAVVVAVCVALWATPAVADPPRFETLPTVG